MHDFAPLIKDLAIMLVVAGIVTLIFQKIRQPLVLGYLVAGIIIGPYTPPGILVTDVDNIKILSELGVIFLMFSLGLEFSFHKLARVGVSAGITGFLEVALMIVMGLAAGKIMGWSFYDSLFLGAAIAISSSTIIVKAFEELGLMKKRFAELVFAISVVDDLVAILLLVFLTTIVTTKGSVSDELFWSTAKLMVVIMSWFLVGYFLIPTLLRRFMQTASDETVTVVAVGLCLFLVSVAAYFHYSTALGAFIMGSILAETTLLHRIEHLIKPIRDIFAAVFFISVGMLINPVVIFQNWPAVIFVSLVTIVGKLIGNGVGAFLTGQDPKTSIRVGCAMAQVGEFSFIIVGLGVLLNATSNKLYPIVVAVSAITTFITPYFIRFSLYFTDKLDKRMPGKMKLFLDSYSTGVLRVFSQSKEKSQYGKSIARFVINAILVTVIFILVNTFVYSEFTRFTTQSWLAKTLSWSCALLLTSPFIWGMLFAFKSSRDTNNVVFANVLIMLSWLITISEITILSIVYFHNWLIVSVLVVAICVIFVLSYKRLEIIYHWFERHLVQNIKKEPATNGHK